MLKINQQIKNHIIIVLIVWDTLKNYHNNIENKSNFWAYPNMIYKDKRVINTAIVNPTFTTCGIFSLIVSFGDLTNNSFAEIKICE